MTQEGHDSGRPGEVIQSYTGDVITQVYYTNGEIINFYYIYIGGLSPLFIKCKSIGSVSFSANKYA